MSRFARHAQTTSIFVAALVAIVLFAGPTRRANAQITGLTTDNTNSSASASTAPGQNICSSTVSGTTAPVGGNAGESRNLLNITSSSPTAFSTRFVADLCSDSGGSTIVSLVTVSCTPGANSETLTVDARLNFGVNAPAGTNYRLTVGNSAAGEVDFGSDGSGATGNVSNITTSQSGSTPFAPFNANSLNLTTATSNGPFGAAVSGVLFTGAGTGSSVAQQIRSTWSGACNTPSNQNECAVRIGLPCTITGAALVGDTTFGPEGQYPGSPARTQANDGQFTTVSLEFCGDGIIQQDGVLNEQCDNGLNPSTGNGGPNSCCTTDCQVRTNSFSCRPAAGECDLAESCNGLSPTCPADAKKASGTTCTDDGNVCSKDICDGSSVTCTHPAGNAGTLCRASVNTDCDPEEFCTGVTTTCPADSHRPDGFGCSSDGNPCTVDACNNASGLCAHTAGNSGAVCRLAADTCDATENCTGTDTACPADAKKPANTACPDDGKLCTRDVCDGSSNACQHPTAFAGTVCRPAVDPVCDFDEVCTGTSPDCPPDVIETRTIDCRDAAGPCDLEEYCTGTSGMCPPDSKVTAGTICRPKIGGADGLCDIDETCDGVVDTCPPDGVQPAGTICRAQNGDCDVAEVCDGTLKTCPADVLADSSVVCRDIVGPCDAPEYCTGTYNICPFDLKADPSTLCRVSVGVCDVDDYCTGTSDACPTDVVEPSSTLCRPSAGFCDVDDFCTGTNNTCPPDAFKAFTTVCRPSAGSCDVDENCTGTAADCPTDHFLAATHLCRADDQSGCDIADFCTGTSNACPPDAKQPDGTQCPGTNVNTCLNGCVTGICTDACMGSGDVTAPGCPQVPAAVVPLCCGNGTVDPGEQCDDGNQLSADTCASLPGDDCQVGAGGTLIRGNIRNPATDKGGCQVEYSVLNPNNALDKFGQPNMLQICTDQDPTCDLDPRPGRCRFHVVACLNNTDPNLPMCTPQGLNTLTIINRPYLKKSSPQLSLIGGNMAKLSHNLQALYDPANPSLGFSISPPLTQTEVGLCTGGMLIDVYAGSAYPRQSQTTAQRIRIKSRNNHQPRNLRNQSNLTLECLARAVP